MAFGQSNYPYFNNPNIGYQASAYPQPIPPYQQRQDIQPMMQPQAAQQPGMIPARYVTGREEAVAAQIIPGDPFIFADIAHGRMYVKQVNPQTMAAEFIEFIRVQPAQQPQQAQTSPIEQFATQAEVSALRADLESLRNMIQPASSKQVTRKAVNLNDE